MMSADFQGAFSFCMYHGLCIRVPWTNTVTALFVLPYALNFCPSLLRAVATNVNPGCVERRDHNRQDQMRAEEGEPQGDDILILLHHGLFICTQWGSARHRGSQKAMLPIPEWKVTCNTGIRRGLLYALIFKSRAEILWTLPGRGFGICHKDFI